MTIVVRAVKKNVVNCQLLGNIKPRLRNIEPLTLKIDKKVLLNEQKKFYFELSSLLRNCKRASFIQKLPVINCDLKLQTLLLQECNAQLAFFNMLIVKLVYELKRLFIRNGYKGAVLF